MFGLQKGYKLMAVTVDWDDTAHTRICFRMVGRWTWQEFNWAWLESVSMMSSVSHKVNFIIDTTEMLSLPSDLFTRILNFVRSQPRHTSISFVATPSGFINLLLGSFKRIVPHESAYLRCVPNVEAARRNVAVIA
jgi:hypothetical protein